MILLYTIYLILLSVTILFIIADNFPPKGKTISKKFETVGLVSGAIWSALSLIMIPLIAGGN